MLRAFVILLAAAAASPAPTPKPVSPELMKSLSDADARLVKLYKDGVYRTSSEWTETDAKGKLKESTQIVTRLIIKDGKPWEAIDKWVEDGTDQKVERQVTRDADLTSGKRKRGEIPFKSPFSVEQQALYEFSDLGPDPDAPGRELLRFTPRKPGKDLEDGTASVDPSGVVRKMKFRPSTFPYFVKALDVVILFEAETTSGNAASQIVVEGEGGFLFVKRKFRLQTDLDQYADEVQK